MTKFEHVVAKGDNDELGVLCPVFDVVCDDGDIAEIQSSIDLIHEVKRRWLSELSDFIVHGKAYSTYLEYV
jgi:hypothetical protein